MRFYMVDRILELHKEVSIKGLKNVSIVEDFFSGQSLEEEPELPTPLLIEALAQLGAWFVAATSNFEKRAVLLSLGELRFHRPARPGDQLLLEDWVVSASDDNAVVSGRIKVGDEVIMEMDECMCAIIPTGNLEDPNQMKMTYEWLITAGR